MAGEGFEIGLDSFGEVATERDGRMLSDAETVRLLVAEARLAESVGIDVFGVGEHYREGRNDSASPVLLAATATERIRLGTSVAVLSANDPVRLYHEFATLDAVLAAGRGTARRRAGLLRAVAEAVPGRDRRRRAVRRVTGDRGAQDRDGGT